MPTPADLRSEAAMTPATLAERYVRSAADAAGEKAPSRKDRDVVLSVALLLACQDVLIHQPAGFDRSATLARAVKHKAEEDADGHHAL